MRYLLCIVFVVGCGNLQPDTPDSKLNSDPNASPNSANVTPNNVNPNNVVVVDPGAWRTSGPATATGKSPGGHALCTLDDVSTSDVAGSMTGEVPPDPWASSPVADGTGRCGDDLETLVWRLHNCERIGAGLQPYQCDLRAVWMSREHTLDMIAQDYFRHDNPAGESSSDRMDRHGVGWAAAAENIATGSDALDLHYSWMDSNAGHRDTILGSYTHAGLGVETRVEGGLLATGVFFTPR